jgi:16S rRNA C967 or C1407 C5-methylase (RsmB/RsmF family)
MAPATGRHRRTAAKQAAILDGAARLVKGGGRLVYATCSFLDDENDFIANNSSKPTRTSNWCR